MHIGVFDSGLGGLTVLRELLNELPECSFTYFGDTAHLPYGSKSPEAICSLSEAAAQFLESQGIDALVIACHTASAWAAAGIRKRLSIPVFDMISPTLEAVRASSCSGPIGVLGTRAMIRSNVYPLALRELGARRVVSQACPLFVPVIEEGLINEPVCRSILLAHLEPLRQASAETVVLGCTHYPMLLPQLREVLSSCLEWIDPAQAVAHSIKIRMRNHDAVDPSDMRRGRLVEGSSGLHQINRCYVTDDPAHFMRMSSLFLGSVLPRVELIETSRMERPLPAV